MIDGLDSKLGLPDWYKGHQQKSRQEVTSRQSISNSVLIESFYETIFVNFLYPTCNENNGKSVNMWRC
jgi:hypothetical protein